MRATGLALGIALVGCGGDDRGLDPIDTGGGGDTDTDLPTTEPTTGPTDPNDVETLPPLPDSGGGRGGADSGSGDSGSPDSS